MKICLTVLVALTDCVQVKLICARILAVSEGEVWSIEVLLSWRAHVNFLSAVVKSSEACSMLLSCTQYARVGVNELVSLGRRAV